MLEKTKLMFLEDTKDMWVNYNKFRRSLSNVLVVFEKFYLIHGVWSVDYHRGMLICYMKYDKDDDIDELNKVFKDQVDYLRSLGFDSSYHRRFDEEFKFMMSMDNFVETITQNQKK